MLRVALIILLVFNAIGAYYGSFMLLADPTGVAIKLPPNMLDGAPFQDYFVPGIILLLVNGVLPTLAALGLIRRKPPVPLPYLPFLGNYHWGWTLALASGLGLLTWMAVQIALLGYYSEFPIQGLMTVIGALITGLTLLPIVQNAYKIKQV